MGADFCAHFFSAIYGINIWRCFFISKNFDRKPDALVNENIRAKEVLVISDDGEKLGVFSVPAGIEIARQHNLDLVCVAPEAPTPVCRLMDYSKFRYEQQRKAREAKKNQRTVTIKEIWVTPVINDNDLITKVKNGRKFLEEGNKLKVTLRFRSRRMLAMASSSSDVLDKVIAMLEDIAIVEQRPILEGRNMNMMFVPKKDK